MENERKKCHIILILIKHKTLMVNIFDLIKILSKVFAFGPYINNRESKTAFSQTYFSTIPPGKIHQYDQIN